MRIAIIGSRKRSDRSAVAAAVAALPQDAIVVSGGCQGPDEWAAAEARLRGLPVVEHLPDLGGCRQRFEYTRAYYARNQRVVDDCDRVIAFVSPDRKGGTEDSLKRAAAAGKPIEIR